MTAAGLQNDRVAAVTGGSRGIGRAVVEALLAEGWRVRFSSLSRASVDAAMADLAGKHGDRVAGAAVDVRDGQALTGWIDSVAEAEGRLDCLVNNSRRPSIRQGPKALLAANERPGRGRAPAVVTRPA